MRDVNPRFGFDGESAWLDTVEYERETMFGPEIPLSTDPSLYVALGGLGVALLSDLVLLEAGVPLARFLPFLSNEVTALSWPMG